jgi:hypothetical protein
MLKALGERRLASLCEYFVKKRIQLVAAGLDGATRLLGDFDWLGRVERAIGLVAKAIDMRPKGIVEDPNVGQSTRVVLKFQFLDGLPNEPGDEKYLSNHVPPFDFQYALVETIVVGLKELQWALVDLYRPGELS